MASTNSVMTATYFTLFVSLQSMLIGLVHDQPGDPLTFMVDCINKARSKGGGRNVDWDDFIGFENEPIFPTGM